MLAALLLLAAGCPPQRGGRGGSRYGGRGDRYGGGSRFSETKEPVLVNFQRLSDAVVETSTSGVPRQDVSRLRRIYCEGRQADPVIFFQFVVSTHWHYYWICSNRRPVRASTKEGARRLKRWLSGFRTQASGESPGCTSPTHTPILQGTHESGIRVVAYCDGQFILNFPDGARVIKSYNMASRRTAAPRPAGTGYGGAAAGTCPSCPQCPSQTSGQCPQCPTCPTCQRCPPRKPCPPPKPCPACDCSREVMVAGKKAFKQGVRKACKRVCQQIYRKCRSIDPKTAMCHTMAEFCSTQCGR